MNLSNLLGTNETTVSQSTAAQLIALLLTSKIVATVMGFLGIPTTPENYATLAILFNTAIAALYTRFAKSSAVPASANPLPVSAVPITKTGDVTS